MYSGTALRGRHNFDCCMVSSFIMFMEEKNQMSAPKTRAYFAIPRMPPNKRLINPTANSLSSSDVSKEPTSPAMMGTTIHNIRNALTLQKEGNDTMLLNISPNL